MPTSAKRPKKQAETAKEADPLLDDLNDEQRHTVTFGTGPFLIIAGAGTGKTTVIARRVAWLIANGHAKPEEILALTFTDKAAGEMEERIDKLLPMGYVDLWVSTFHAFCQRILEAHAIDIGLPGDFRLLSSTDAYLLARKNLASFPLDYYRPLGNPTKFVHALLKHFSRAKEEIIVPKDYAAYAATLPDDTDEAVDEKKRSTEIADTYAVYEQLLLDHGCFDMSDLHVRTIELFRKRPRILAEYRTKFKYVIVDEFQDTNWAQFELVKMLVGDSGNLMVVGDDDQSIYKFRGASISNILQFKNDYPNAAEVVLTQNYRSYQNLLDLSYKFIQLNNPNRLEARLSTPDGKGITKRLVAAREGEGTIAHLHYATLEDEARGVIDRIQHIKDQDPERLWSDFCILVRSNAGAEDFSNELQRRGIPYHFHALKGLYNKPVVLDALAYFRLLDNYHESSTLYRTLSSPPYRIDGTDLVTLAHEARKKAQSLYEVIKRHLEVAELAPETRTTLDRLVSDLTKHTELVSGKSVSELLVKYLYESGYVKVLRKDDTQDGRDNVSYLKQFLDRVKRYEAAHDAPTLKHFMEEFELERESGEEGGLAFDVETGPDMVRIMTVHAAKGLEFPFVFVGNMVDKRFPSTARGGEIELPDALTKEIVPEGDAHLEEERRLFYVAMTRARDGLFFSSAEDYGGKQKKKLSRFMMELGFEKPTQAPSYKVLDVPPPEVAPVPRNVPYAPPTHFSFTQLAAYSTCPLQYKFAHLVKIPIFGKPSLSFGKTMHSALEKFLGLISERRAAGADPATLPVTREELMQIYSDVWEDDWYDTKERKEEYRARGTKLLDLFYDQTAKQPPDPLFLEKDFKLKIGQYAIKGKIDRIDNVEGGVEIIDYKTGKPKEEGKISSDDKKQLMLYQVAVTRLFGMTPVRLTYHYLEDGSQISFIGDEADIEKFDAGVEQTLASIAEGKFEATPGMHCKFCDFASICEFRA